MADTLPAGSKFVMHILKFVNPKPNVQPKITLIWSKQAISALKR